MDERERGGRTCRCGHLEAAHRHLRRGSDCALCPGTCRRFRPAGGPLRRGPGILGALGTLGGLGARAARGRRR